MHTGIRLKIDTPAGTILEGDSDWLHMMAVFTEGAPVPDFLDTAPPEPVWHEIAQLFAPGGAPAFSIWIQPVMLPDEYPDDEPEAADDA